MPQWYASVNYGLESIAGERIKAQGAANVKLLNSALVFCCPHEINAKCINNLFLVLSSFVSKNIESAASKLSRSVFSFPKLNGKTFRIIIMNNGKLCSISNSIMAELEKNIAGQSKLNVNRAHPEIEIWLNRRNDSQTFFMLRIKKHPSFDKTLMKGELRSDIVDIMLYKARLTNRSEVADLFGGWGAIPAAIIESGQYKRIFTGDTDDKCVKHLHERLNKARGCTVRKWDARMLPLKDKSVDAIITDPPWGEYVKIDTHRFYYEFIGEAARILRPGGSLVFLSSAFSAACGSLNAHRFTYSHTSFKLNGKDTFLFCAARG